VSMWGAISIQEAIIKTPDPSTPQYQGNRIDHTPGFIFSGGIDYQILPQLKTSLWTNGQDAYYLDPSNSSGKFGDYALLNLNVDYQVNKLVGLQFQMKNITGTYWEYAWYDAPNKLTNHSPGDGRAFYGAININYDL
jgi:iron complex outermembrane recepter protein